MQPQSKLAMVQWWLSAVLLALALTLGGGQGTLGDSLCQLLALPLIAIVIVRHQWEPDANLPRWAWLAALPLALPLLQLLPLPEALWTLAPARVQMTEELAAAGVQPGMRVGLAPLFAERALLWLLPAAALFLAGLQFGLAQRRALFVVYVGVAAAAVLLGFAQAAGGSESTLRFYEITNSSGAVGFFANRNHHASLMAMGLPFVLLAGAAWFNRDHEVETARWLGLGVCLLMAAMLVLGVAMTNSRAGFGIGILAIALCVPGILALRRRCGTRRILALGALLGMAVFIQFALAGLVQRFQGDPLDDFRVRFLPIVAEAAQMHAPWGTGIGGFRRTFEGFDTEDPGRNYVNHAHNDVAELWLEGGWPAVPVVGVLLGAFAVVGWRIWRSRPKGAEQGLAVLQQAAWIALLLVLLHSLVDYPLRTTAHLAFFGMLAAFLVRPSSSPSTRA